jgi:hypothetical protein
MTSTSKMVRLIPAASTLVIAEHKHINILPLKDGISRAFFFIPTPLITLDKPEGYGIIPLCFN